MLYEETYQKLIDMRLRGFAEEFRAYLDHPRQGDDDLPFEDRFAMMVDREWNQRQQRSLTRRLKSAKFREQACVEDINYRHPRGLDRSVMARLSSCNWIREHEDIIFTGPTGLGKTWLACALANKACREGFSARYTRVSRLLHALEIAHADGSYLKELDKLAKIDVLILDDWALTPLKSTNRHDILEIIEDRSGIRSTIVTSQFPINTWHERIGEPTIADAIMDRLINRAHKITLKSGPSLRGRRKNNDQDT